MPRPNARRDHAGVVQIDLTADEVDKLDTLLEAHRLRSRAAFFRHLLRVQPTPPPRKT
jgi:hypothetical protein